MSDLQTYKTMLDSRGIKYMEVPASDDETITLIRVERHNSLIQFNFDKDGKLIDMFGGLL